MMSSSDGQTVSSCIHHDVHMHPPTCTHAPHTHISHHPTITFYKNCTRGTSYQTMGGHVSQTKLEYQQQSLSRVESKNLRMIIVSFLYPTKFLLLMVFITRKDALVFCVCVVEWGTRLVGGVYQEKGMSGVFVHVLMVGPVTDEHIAPWVNI